MPGGPWRGAGPVRRGSRGIGPALAGIGLCSCVSAPPLPAARPAAPPRAALLEEVRAAYDGYCSGLESFSASGDLDLRDASTGKSGRLGVRVVASRGGRLYLKGTVAVVTALEVASNGERFWFQVPSKKTVWTGSAAAAPEAEGGAAPYHALRPRDVALALLPEPLDPGAEETLVLEGDRSSFTLTLARSGPGGAGPARRRIVLSRDTLQPLGSRAFDERGDVVSEVSLQGFRDGLPRQVSISRPLQGYSASFSFDKVAVNVRVPERAFEPRTPDGYKVVEIR